MPSSYAKPERYYPDKDKGNGHAPTTVIVEKPKEACSYVGWIILAVVILIVLIIVFLYFCFRKPVSVSNLVTGYKKVCTAKTECDGTVVKEKFLIPVKLKISDCTKSLPPVYTIVAPRAVPIREASAAATPLPTMKSYYDV